MDSRDRQIIEALRANFPASARPYAAIAKRLGVAEATVLRRLKALRRSGLLRSVRAALDQTKLGLKGNILVAWRVSERRANAVGRLFAARAEASHVVLRGDTPGWPYNLYTMIHAPTRSAARRVVCEMAEASRVKDYVELATRRELKKSAPRYF